MASLTVVAVVHAAAGRLVSVGGHVAYLADDVKMSPTGNGAPGAAFAQNLINWLGQYGLWFALAAMIIGGAIYGVSTYGGNSYQGSRGRTVALAGAAGAVIIGLAPGIINLLFHAAHG
jgi:hypothetical protein